MAVDKKESERKLSEAEAKRLARYEETSRELAEQGYTRNELTVGIVKANVYAMAFGLPVVAACFLLFLFCNRDRGITDFMDGGFFLSLAVVIVLVVVHELIHGITWSLFAPNHFADIEFGFMVEYLTPYCTCTRPLPKGGYIAGALAPLVALGLIPMAVSMATGSFSLFFIGAVMTISAGGDVMIVHLLLKHGKPLPEQLVYDHPTQAGCTVFER